MLTLGGFLNLTFFKRARMWNVVSGLLAYISISYGSISYESRALLYIFYNGLGDLAHVPILIKSIQLFINFALQTIIFSLSL